MMQGVIVLLLAYLPALLALSAVSGWTYKTTDDTCAATNEDPCGPVSIILDFFHSLCRIC